MVKKLLGFLSKEISGIHEAAYLLAIFAFSSHILALIRDRLLAGTFGASEMIDVYYASFRIPDLLYVLITSFISASILVPFLSKYLEDKSHIQNLVNSLFTIFIYIIAVTGIIILIFTEPILKIFVPDLFSGEFSNELILFTRILVLSPIILGISQLFGSIVQAYRKFFVYAISPALYNLGIILGIVLFYPIFGSVGLIYGVIAGLIFQILVQLPTVAKQGMVPRFTTKIEWGKVKEIALISFPRTITLASSQIILLFLVGIAATLTVGSITIFNFAYNLQSVPLAIIGVSYSLAAFPTLSRLFAKGNTEEFLSHLIISAKHIIFWSFPVIIMFIVLRAQIVRTIWGTGEFGWNETRLTAAALALFAISVIAQNLILLFVRGYYSAGETKKPLFIGIFSAGLTVGLAFFLIHLFQISPFFQIFIEDLLRVVGISGTSVLMLPLAFSVGMILNAILLWISFEKRFVGFSKTLWSTLINSLFASLVGGSVAYSFLQVFDDVFDINTLFGIFSQGFFSGILGLAVWLIILKLLRSQELDDVWRTLRSKIWRAKPIVPAQKEL